MYSMMKLPPVMYGRYRRSDESIKTTRKSKATLEWRLTNDRDGFWLLPFDSSMRDGVDEHESGGRKSVLYDSKAACPRLAIIG
jgi:hypothetical protein